MSPPLFLFGTLCHPPLLREVIGDDAHVSCKDARLPDFSVAAVEGGLFPVIADAKGSMTSGIVAFGLTDADHDALNYYEAVFGYVPRPVTLSDGTTALAYLPPAGLWEGVETWDLAAWVRDWGEISLRSAREVMRFRGLKTPEQVGGMFPMIRARAASSLNAETSRHGARTMQGAVEVVEQRRPYANFFALDEFDLKHARFDGEMSPVVTRAVFRASDATLVLPYDAHRDRVLLVEQFRPGPMARGDRRTWQLEPVAGRIDAGESAEAAARREAVEEAGLQIGALHEVGEVYCSPGNSSEFYYMFVGEADLPDSAARIGGLQEEDEDIRAHLLGFDEMMEMCDRFELTNAPLLILALWLARHRPKLRAAAAD